MTNEERDLIAKFIARVGGVPQQQQGGFLGGSVPATQPQLPPVDREADQFIAQQFQQYPEARYRITQTALVQEAALAEAQNRIRRLEWEVEQARQAMQQQAQQMQQQPQQSRGFLGGLFGGGSSQPQQRQGFGPGGYPAGFQPTTPPPQPQYPPGYNPGMFQQRGGSGFLGSALTTAAGVAGGLVVGNALMNMFSGDAAGTAAAAASDPTGGLFGGAGAAPVSDPTGGFGGDTAGLTQDAGFGGGFGGDPFAQGGADKGYDTAASYDQGGDPFGGDAGGFDDGGFGDEA